MKNIIKVIVLLLLFSLATSCMTTDHARKSPYEREYEYRLYMNMYWYQWQNYPQRR